jgi:hypothetical protein
MTLTQHLVQFLAKHPDEAFSTDDLLSVAHDEKWCYGCFGIMALNYRRLMLQTLRRMEIKRRIVSGKNFYRPQWRIDGGWALSVGMRSLSNLASVSFEDGDRKTTIYPLTVN